jgi:catechol 2,3-dioxygenase
MNKTPHPIAQKPVLHHVTFKTTHIDEMMAWYKAVIGCEASFIFAGGAWMTNDAANHRIAFLTTPAVVDDPNKVAHAGMHHIAFEFGTHQALFDNYERLAEVGILPHICFDHGLTMSFYYLDPDGNSVELQSDNFGNWIHSSHWMETSREFAREPIGVEVDPPTMITALKQGVSLSTLLERTRSGEFLPAKHGDARLPF